MMNWKVGDMVTYVALDGTHYHATIESVRPSGDYGLCVHLNASDAQLEPVACANGDGVLRSVLEAAGGLPPLDSAL